ETPVRGTAANEMSPTAARISGRLQAVARAGAVPIPELQPLITLLQLANEETAVRVETQMDRLFDRLGAANHVAEEMMITRGAIQDILNVLGRLIQIPSSRALPHLVAEGEDPFASEIPEIVPDGADPFA
ncbi:MAG: hypothetical protein WCK49_10385, partial [Myxococcaceae bacterium]